MGLCRRRHLLQHRPSIRVAQGPAFARPSWWRLSGRGPGWYWKLLAPPPAVRCEFGQERRYCLLGDACHAIAGQPFGRKALAKLLLQASLGIRGLSKGHFARRWRHRQCIDFGLQADQELLVGRCLLDLQALCRRDLELELCDLCLQTRDEDLVLLRLPGHRLLVARQELHELGQDPSVHSWCLVH